MLSCDDKVKDFPYLKLHKMKNSQMGLVPI